MESTPGTANYAAEWDKESAYFADNKYILFVTHPVYIWVNIISIGFSMDSDVGVALYYSLAELVSVSNVPSQSRQTSGKKHSGILFLYHTPGTVPLKVRV